MERIASALICKVAKAICESETHVVGPVSETIYLAKKLHGSDRKALDGLALKLNEHTKGCLIGTSFVSWFPINRVFHLVSCVWIVVCGLLARMLSPDVECYFDPIKIQQHYMDSAIKSGKCPELAY